MPITWLQFHLGNDRKTEDCMRAVAAFLETHSDLAYNQTEIAQALQDEGQPIDSDALTKTLDELAYLGAIDKREVRNDTYFMHEADLDDLV